MDVCFLIEAACTLCIASIEKNNPPEKLSGSFSGWEVHLGHRFCIVISRIRLDQQIKYFYDNQISAENWSAGSSADIFYGNPPDPQYDCDFIPYLFKVTCGSGRLPRSNTENPSDPAGYVLETKI